jgi:nucleosome binding factor SPN SPT16 subunit
MAFQMSLKVRYLNSKNVMRTKTLIKFSADTYQKNTHLFLNKKAQILNIVKGWLKEKEVYKVIDLHASLGRESTPNFVCDEFVGEINSLIV